VKEEPDSKVKRDEEILSNTEAEEEKKVCRI